jgi:ribosome biogenesis GTPase A
MAKTIKDVQNIKGVDLIIEVVDARAVNASSNPELSFNNHLPKLIIALKSDLSDLNIRDLDHDVLIGSIKDQSFRARIIQAIDLKLADKMNRFHSKGLLTPQFNIMVVGLPNVGKSSLINFLAKKKILIVENRPGITKNKQLIKITNNYFIYDTPGVFVKKINRDEDGYILALIGTIRKEVLPLNEVVQ